MKKISFNAIQLIVMVLLFTMCTSVQGQVIVNGDFELWPAGCPYNVAPNGWTNFSTSLGPDQAGTCAGSVVSHQGNSHMNLVWYSSNGLKEGATQMISGLTIGAVCEIEFYAINDQGLYSFGDPAILDFYVDSTVVFTTPELFSGGAWTAYTVSFTPTATSQKIGFRVKYGTSGTSGCVGIDAVSVLNPTGTEDISGERELRVYPNPFSTSATVQTDKTLNNAMLTLYDAFGRQVLQMDNITGRSITLQRENLATGVYSIRLTEGNKLLATQRILITE